MEDDGRQLNEEQRAALGEFIEDKDRGKAAIFVGREAELSHVRGCIKRLLRRQNEVAPGVDLTTVIQGAPGAGKSALLEKIAEDWPLGGEEQAAAVSLDPGLLTLPTPDFLKAIASEMERIPDFIQVLWKYIRSISVSVGSLASVEVGTETSKSSNKPPVPVILLFDEIQTELKGSPSSQSREYLTRNLRLLHTGQHKAPMFPVYGGLANSADLLRTAGLTRLAMESELTLPGFSDDEIDELMTRFVEEHLSSARPAPSTLERWGDALRRDSQGWPMHCRNFLIALCEQIRARDWRPQAVNLDTVRMRAQGLRCAYYEQRMQGVLRNRYILVSKVLDEMRGMPPMPDDQITEAIARAHRERASDDFGRDALPEGVTASQAFDAMLHAGIVQKVDEFGYACPIPSLSGHIAARATLAPSRLHEAVLKAKPQEVDQAMNRCRDDGERGELLQVTDIRGRTPLMLAVELGLASLVEHLVEVESHLPTALRSVDFTDSEGHSAQDHAVASGDERMVALLERLQEPE